MGKVLASIACNLDEDILRAALPLLAAEKVQAMEWSFDALYDHKNIPDWFNELLYEYAQAERLIGHGVFFSMFSAKWSEGQSQWLKNLERVSKEFDFQHITEHFGFMTGADFHTGAPLGVPYSAITLAIGKDRLQRIQAACNCPVGLENLAFSYSMEEVKIHGAFLNELLEPINGFIILDLHNFFCQLHNFNIDFQLLIKLYPLEKVREIHISGGSWEANEHDKSKKIRRDTHDDSVPNDVFTLLEKTLPLCPNLKFVVLEQLGGALRTELEIANYQNDFLKMESIIDNFNLKSTKSVTYNFMPAPQEEINSNLPLENAYLFQQQMELSAILENAQNYQDAKNILSKSSLANSTWKVENWHDEMLATAIAIAQKWKGRSV
jgi:uncharacterized protein